MTLLRKMIPSRWRPVEYLPNLTWERTGGRVLAGPFAGMRYAHHSHGSVYIPKLLGIYERELSASVEAICALAPDRIIDAGAAEGYYAVGLALRLPSTQVIAYEMEAAGRTFLAEMVSLNGVEGRVEIRGKAEPAELQAALEGTARPLVVCDVEGYELVLLDPGAVPALRGTHILVELHDFVHQGLSETIEQRFAPTHRVTRIWQEERESSEFPYATTYTRLLPKTYLNRTVTERRPERMSWFWMEPLS